MGNVCETKTQIKIVSSNHNPPSKDQDPLFHNINILTNKEAQYLTCPICLSNSIIITLIYFHKEELQYRLKFKCHCTKNKEQDYPFHSLITPDKPSNICNEHKGSNIMNSYCIQCQMFICSECKVTSHKDKEHEIVSSEQITHMYNNKNSNVLCKELKDQIDLIKYKEKEFINLFVKKKTELILGIEKIIINLNELKSKYQKEMTTMYNNTQNIFSFIRTLYIDYHNSIINDNCNHLNGNTFPICSLAHISTLNINNMFNYNNNLTTNINDIIYANYSSENFHPINLLFKYDFNFPRNILQNTFEVIVPRLKRNKSTINEDNNNDNEHNKIINNKDKPIKNEVKHILEYKSTLQGHKNKVISLIILHNENIASGGYDNIINIWTGNSYLASKSIQEEGSVLCLLEFEPNKLLSGTSENNINLWCLESLTKLYSFQSHTLWVNCLVALTSTKFASCSNDATIIIWDYKSQLKQNDLESHSDCILCMILLDNNNLCTGSADNTIKIWNWTEQECVTTLYGHDKWVKCLCQLSNGDLLSGSDDKTIKVWRKDVCIYTLKGHDGSVRTLCMGSRKYVISGSFDCSIRVWDVKNGYKCIQEIYEHTWNVICVVKCKKNKVISCSNDKTIKIWKWNEPNE
jgi:WD40 repeat protein